MNDIIKQTFKRHIRTLLKGELFQYRYGLTLDEQRALTSKRTKAVLDCIRETVGVEAFVKDRAFAIFLFEEVNFFDLSLAVKIAVHLGLSLGSIVDLGTQKQVAHFQQGYLDYSIPGCFAMTELGHGSNVASLETTATYEPTSKQFIIHTPNDQAS